MPPVVFFAIAAPSLTGLPWYQHALLGLVAFLVFLVGRTFLSVYPFQLGTQLEAFVILVSRNLAVAVGLHDGANVTMSSCVPISGFLARGVCISQVPTMFLAYTCDASSRTDFQTRLRLRLFRRELVRGSEGGGRSNSQNNRVENQQPETTQKIRQTKDFFDPLLLNNSEIDRLDNLDSALHQAHEITHMYSASEVRVLVSWQHVGQPTLESQLSTHHKAALWRVGRQVIFSGRNGTRAPLTIVVCRGLCKSHHEQSFRQSFRLESSRGISRCQSLGASLAFSCLLVLICAACFLHTSDISTAFAPKYIANIRSSSDHLLHLVNKILDFSRLAADTPEQRFPLEPQMFNVRAMVSSMIRMFHPTASLQTRQITHMLHWGYECVHGCLGDSTLQFPFAIAQACDKGVKLIGDCKGVASSTVLWGDNTRIQQIIVNFMGNATKFTQEGQVVLSVSLYVRPSSAYMTVPLRSWTSDSFTCMANLIPVPISGSSRRLANWKQWDFDAKTMIVSLQIKTVRSCCCVGMYGCA